jgi:nickel-type superoxide dismutase maturation protease
MFPTYRSGDRVLVSRSWYRIFSPKVGDVVIVRHPDDDTMLVKRILRITSNGVFVAGDNPEASTDSRTLGMLSNELIVGKVIWRYHHKKT